MYDSKFETKENEFRCKAKDQVEQQHLYIVFINELNNYMKIFMESIFNKSRKKWLGIK